MNSRRENRKKMYNDLYKKYLIYLKKTGAQKNRNNLLKSTNSELSKEVVRLKEEMKKCSSINSNLKTEIHELTLDRKNLTDDNKGLYNTLTSLHNDTVQFEKRISDLLSNLDPQIESYGNQNSLSMPINGQVVRNPKAALQLSESNYSRYNFKDIVYVQDLSPIMEENAEVKKLIKPSDITRRLGHRSKVTHPYKSSENLHEAHGTAIDEDAETNVINCSSWSARTPDFDEEINIVEKQPTIVEEEATPILCINNAKELLSSPAGCIESNNISADESILCSLLPDHSEHQRSTIYKNENDSVSKESPLPDVNVVSSSDSESLSNENDFRPSIFVNVFPRRRKINDGCSFSLGSVEEEGNEESSCFSCEKENLSPMVSSNTLKNIGDQSSIKVRSDSFLKSDLSLTQASSIDLMPETPHQEESVIENTCSDIERNLESIALDIKYGARTYAVNLDRLEIMEGCSSLLKEERNAKDEIDLEEMSMLLQSEEQSFIEKQESPSELTKDVTNKEHQISTSASKRKSSATSIVGCSSGKKSSQILLKGSKSEEKSLLQRKSPKKSLRSGDSCKSVQEKESEGKRASRTADRISVKSTSGVTPERKSLEDSKKSLRPKKPINFRESPVMINHKRKRKVDKNTK